MTNDKPTLPALDALKDQARRLRSRLASEGEQISHSKSLELVAAQYGYRDWNTLHAAVGNRPPVNPWVLGSRVKGHYLGQAFNAEILSAHAIGAEPGRYRLTFKFDEPVDVVTFESFSAFRQRVTATIDGTGRTVEKTSNGRPHLELEW
ncbi:MULTISPECIES: glyoxalase superfamily protein [unclassified Sinorhizobium]|uniref:glyoxalase superfamily protein n=1 Tax=unclassified Sinorhizobium TaxID=2613772 RepID=UPI0024C23AF4|nr:MULTISPECIES: glyoxalase superfamily protein [unclassified Sinorhizobium]MDK1375356.1 glyoxalase superfamily protein [Sinorhizobium sp. 6-70]MDK1477976.1 glyoxalase superfamily protein [Sinorhizobium sp. 6-117]